VLRLDGVRDGVDGMGAGCPRGHVLRLPPVPAAVRSDQQTKADFRGTMHYETHQNVIDDLEARILTIRDSL